jgi:hypothetical protein
MLYSVFTTLLDAEACDIFHYTDLPMDVNKPYGAYSKIVTNYINSYDKRRNTTRRPDEEVMN